MYLHKVRHPVNFRFAKRFTKAGKLDIGPEKLTWTIKDAGSDVFRLRIAGKRWAANYSQARFTTSFAKKSSAKLTLGQNGSFTLFSPDSQPVLTADPGRWFGMAGDAWIMCFDRQPEARFYGMGQKNNGFEKSGTRSRFWNTDVFSDFSSVNQIRTESTDPMYVSVPYLIVKQGESYVGILANNPGAMFMDIDSVFHFQGRESRTEPPFFSIGSNDGMPEVWFIYGPSLDELTCKLQRLVGVTPMPPLWVLGHHQCRWGYRGAEDLERLDQGFRKHDIPCDGLWLDIDYMDQYKVFTLDPQHFVKPQTTFKKLHANNRHIVVILDPGVKKAKNYEVYESGKKAGVFCRNAAGQDFTGFVWPGETVFPDFSKAKVRQWWADYVAEMVKMGIDAFWIDMNDPSLGAVEPFDMLFDKGRLPHWTYHNQYALGMAQATRAGMEQARPNERPFIVSRSGFIGQSRYSAIWNGDNCANYFHLKQSIPMALNLSLSGIPFNAPDVAGFFDDATEALFIDWYKAGFLYPFLRNHSAFGSRDQEPWAFGAEPLEIVRHYIALRYKLLPYLYQLFCEQELHGRPMLRPLFYEFPGTPEVPLDLIADQFLAGPSLMQAPFIEENQVSRTIALPGRSAWFSAADGSWMDGNQHIHAENRVTSTPLFVRAGALIPMFPGLPVEAQHDLSEIELHLFLPETASGSAESTYRWDDGITLEYRDGKRSEVAFQARWEQGKLTIDAQTRASGYGSLRVAFVLYRSFEQISCRVDGQAVSLKWQNHNWQFTGGKLAARKSSIAKVG